MKGRFVTYGILATIAVVLITLYCVLDPMGTYFPKCPLHELTGLNCPGCGTQRAIHAYLNGHLLEGLRFNYVLPLLVFYLALGLSSGAMSRKNPLRRIAYNTTYNVMMLVTLLSWGIVRNILGI